MAAVPTKQPKEIPSNAQNRDVQSRTSAASAATDRTSGGRATQEQLPGRAGAAYEITRADLPLHCPMKGTPLWNMHPRVYLPIEESGEERCPYCGAVYVLKD